MFLKLKISANEATFIRLIFFLIGALLVLLSYNYLGYFFLYLNFIFDNVDGQICRVTKKASYSGQFCDGLLDNFINYVRSFTFDSAGNLILYNRTNPNNDYGIYSYQLSPQITIPAGALTGSFSFSATDDSSFENTEDIIITPGQPMNATLTATAPLSIDILDNDDAPLISFELSNENIYENSETSVTLTASVDVQSGVEITIPFTMDGSADYIVGDPDLSEYSVRETGTETETSQIVIPPNSTSANITISTYGFNDDEVEMAESIIFNFTEVQLGNTGAFGELEQQSISLNLLSEDLSTIDNTTVESNELTEGESTTMQVTINSPTSEDIYVPVVFTGTADKDIDFSVVTAFAGEESLYYELSGNYIMYDRFGSLENGNLVGIYSNTLTIQNPSFTTANTAQLSTGVNSMQIAGNDIYVSNSTQIIKLDLTIFKLYYI